MEHVEPGAVYEHYNGNRYRVEGVAYHSETLERMVVYRSLAASGEFREGTRWVRPLAMFTETVEVDGVRRPRFRRLDREETV